MNKNTLPFTPEELESIARQYPTPFYLYDEKGITKTARRLKAAFAWNEGFKEYFAVKAAPNPHLLKILKREGFGADCSSLPELLLAKRAGISGEEIMFTSNNTPAAEFQQAVKLGAIINLDDIGHLPYLEEHAGLPPILSFRYNPGALKKGNAIIGNPLESKFGVTRQQLLEGYKMARDKGVSRFGIHTMVASNELNPAYFIETAEILFQLIIEISKEVGITFEFANIGGGIGIPYQPEEQAVDLQQVGRGIQQAYQRIIQANGLPPLKLFMENGRLLTGPHGYLITRVRHVKHSYKTFVGVDANMAHLMRPAVYGAYHHITAPGKESLGMPAAAPQAGGRGGRPPIFPPSSKLDETPAQGLEKIRVDVVGSLCENNDKFAINRPLPPLEPGDLLVIHDAGAHGHAMGFNYNGKLRSAELLRQENGQVRQIRRAETVEDYFATLV